MMPHGNASNNANQEQATKFFQTLERLSVNVNDIIVIQRFFPRLSEENITDNKQGGTNDGNEVK